MKSPAQGLTRPDFGLTFQKQPSPGARRTTIERQRRAGRGSELTRGISWGTSFVPMLGSLLNANFASGLLSRCSLQRGRSRYPLMMDLVSTNRGIRYGKSRDNSPRRKHELSATRRDARRYERVRKYYDALILRVNRPRPSLAPTNPPIHLLDYPSTINRLPLTPNP